MLQIVTGILLAIVYVPSAGHAWNSLEVLNHQLELGWFLRAVHGWGSNFMVAVVLVHMAQVFMFGSYKYPRELTWILGVFLLLMTLGMAFTGQVLRFDQDAYWGLGIGASIASRIPVIGGNLVHLMLGGPIIAARLRYSGNDAFVRGPARMDGAQTRYQRVAHAWPHCAPFHIFAGIQEAHP
jgi:ubiquinol-cytochrome c reductase cytochrome b subunit